MTDSDPPYWIVQPYGRHLALESTRVSSHATVSEAFAELDRLSAQMLRTGTAPEMIELYVVDCLGRRVPRPNAH